MSIKDEKLKDVIHRLAADFFSRVSNRTSLITVTDVELKSRNSKAIILITVLPQTQEDAVLDFIHRQLGEFREYVGKNARMMRVPFFEVAIDKGEKNRQRLDEIQNSL